MARLLVVAVLLATAAAAPPAGGYPQIQPWAVQSGMFHPLMFQHPMGVHGARPAAPAMSGSPESFNMMTDYAQWSARKVHDAFSPPYSWMMQLGMDMYGVKNPGVFNYWNYPSEIAGAMSYVMAPTEEDKAKAKAAGKEDPDDNPVKAAFNAAGAYMTGGDPVNAFMQSLKDGDPIKAGVGVLTGKQSPMSMVPMLLGTASQSTDGKASGGAPAAFNPLQMLFGKTPKGMDPLSMLMGTALPQSGMATHPAKPDTDTTATATTTTTTSSVDKPEETKVESKDAVKMEEPAMVEEVKTVAPPADAETSNTDTNNNNKHDLEAKHDAVKAAKPHEDPMFAMVKGLMGGSSKKGADPMMAMMQGLLSPSSSSKGDDPMAGIIKGLISGDSKGSPLVGLMQGLMGGGSGAKDGPMDDPFMKMVMGGAQAMLGSSSSKGGSDPLMAMAQSLLAPSAGAKGKKDPMLSLFDDIGKVLGGPAPAKEEKGPGLKALKDALDSLPK